MTSPTPKNLATFIWQVAEPAPLLPRAAEHGFYNVTEHTLESVAGAPDEAAANLLKYLGGFSENAREVFDRYRLLTSSFDEQALATGSDAAQPTLGMEDLSGLRLNWPTTQAAQTLMLHAATKLQESIATLRRAISPQRQRLAERKQALLTAAVSGQIDVTTARGVDAE